VLPPFWHCLQRPWPIEAPNIPHSKSHVHFLRLRSFQSICPILRPFVTFCNAFLFYGGELSAPRPTPKLEGHPCRLSATAYSIYLQLPSISGGRLLHPQPEDVPCRGDKGSTCHSFQHIPQVIHYIYLSVWKTIHYIYLSVWKTKSRPSYAVLSTISFWFNWIIREETKCFKCIFMHFGEKCVNALDCNLFISFVN
jgi:hypothetical protein